MAAITPIHKVKPLGEVTNMSRTFSVYHPYHAYDPYLCEELNQTSLYYSHLTTIYDKSKTTADSDQDSISLNNGDLTVDYKFFKQTNKENSVICKELFVSAGSVGNTELLLKSVNSKQSGDKLILSKDGVIENIRNSC